MALPPPPSLINLSDYELDHTAAVWCMVKDRCDHDKGFLEAWHLNRYSMYDSESASPSPPSSSDTEPFDLSPRQPLDLSVRTEPLDQEMGEIGENVEEMGVTGEIVEDSSSGEDTDSDDVITSSQRPLRPRVVFYQGDRPQRFGGMLTLKKPV